MGLPQKFNMWNKHGGVWKRLVAGVLPNFMMAGVLPNFSLNSQTIVTVWHTFPTTVDAEWMTFSTSPFAAAIA